MARVPVALDHLVYATPALARTVENIEAAFGVRPLPGGAHPAWGTRNAILPLSPDTYLELIGPDPGNPAGPRPMIFGLANLTTPRLVTWAAKGTHLATLVGRALTRGIRLGAPAPGNRRRPDGTMLSWELTDPLQITASGLVPFFIDWGATAHPATTTPSAVTLAALHAVHPEAATLLTTLRALDLDLAVEPGPQPGLVATFRTPRGPVTLQ